MSINRWFFALFPFKQYLFFSFFKNFGIFVRRADRGWSQNTWIINSSLSVAMPLRRSVRLQRKRETESSGDPQVREKHHICAPFSRLSFVHIYHWSFISLYIHTIQMFRKPYTPRIFVYTYIQSLLNKLLFRKHARSITSLNNEVDINALDNYYYYQTTYN